VTGVQTCALPIFLNIRKLINNRPIKTKKRLLGRFLPILNY